MKLYLPRPLSLAVGTIFCGLATAQINLSNVNTTGLSATCISVMQQSVACDPLLLQVGYGRYEDDATLSTVCTTSCATALTTYIRRINQACGTTRYDGGDGYLYLAAFGGESTYERYQTTCLKNSAGKRCNAVIRDLLGVNPSNQVPSSSIATQYTSLVCNDCFISSLATVLAMPISSAGAYSTALAEVTSSCNTTIAVTTPATSTTWSLPATTTPAGCAGSQYAIQAGDTCQSISLKSGISSAAMLQANGLQAYCSNFPTNGSVCIPTSMRCSPYALKVGDTCDTIASKHGLTKPQVVSWNQEVGPLCGNIGKLASKGMTLCVSNPGGDWVDPSPSDHQPTTTETPWTLIITNSGTAFDSFPSATPIPTLLPNENYVTPFANGSWLNCDVYMSPPVLLDMSNGTFSYTCADVADAYGITMDDLLLWNPGINTTGGFSDPCELSFAYKYCVVPVASLPTDTTKSCAFPALAEPGWTCDMYVQRYNVTKAAFATWNPSVGTDCSGFQQGKTYCASVEHYRPANTISTCSYWSMANNTNPADSPCGIFETKYKLDHGRFVAWNPSVQSDCSGIVRGYDYCVGTPSFHPGFP